MTVSIQTIAGAVNKFALENTPTGFKLEALHEYHDSQGKVAFWRMRAKNQMTGEKRVFPIRHEKNGFRLKEPAFPADKPLYRLPILCATPTDPVILVEGEWCADKLAGVGVLATTSGGAQSAGSADWSPLAGRSVSIWPDNDSAGLDYGEEAVAKLLRIGCQVRMLDPKTIGLGDKQDVVDWLENHPSATGSDIRKLFEGIEERSGQNNLKKLYDYGFTEPEIQKDSSHIDLLTPPGLVAIEICHPQGAAELQAATPEGSALEETLKITAGSRIYTFYRWREIDVLDSARKISDVLVVIPALSCISVPANGLWNANAGECEVAFFPDWALKRWPVILQAHPPGVSFEGQSISHLSQAAFAKQWPAPISDAGLVGLAGDYIKLVGPQTEADPSVLLVALLTGVGAMFDTSTYINVGNSKHFTNLFSTIVGESAQARKGTATTEVVQFVRRVDAKFGLRIFSGLSSGEGLIEAVRDARLELTPSELKDQPAELKPVDAGVADKRLLVVENEFAQALQSMARNGNTLSPVLRQAWDGQPLGVLARTNKNKCEHPHVALLASITNEELKKLLSNSERNNGFGNRFLWPCARRARSLPFGGTVDQTVLSDLAAKVRDVLVWAQDGRCVTWGDDAGELWEKFYGDLSHRTAQGLYGNIVSRTEAQVLRIALIYAVLDKSMSIRLPHLIAAIEVWRYCDESARYIFDGFSRDETEEVILDAVRSRPHGMTQTEISRLLGGHKTKEQLQRVLQPLREQGLISSRQQDTDGRSAIIWRAC